MRPWAAIVVTSPIRAAARRGRREQGDGVPRRARQPRARRAGPPAGLRAARGAADVVEQRAVARDRDRRARRPTRPRPADLLDHADPHPVRELGADSQVGDDGERATAVRELAACATSSVVMPRAAATRRAADRAGVRAAGPAHVTRETATSEESPATASRRAAARHDDRRGHQRAGPRAWRRRARSRPARGAAASGPPRTSPAERAERPRASARRSSIPPSPVARDLDRSQRLHLRLEPDSEPLEHPAPPFGHHRDHVGGRGVAVVLDEVRVLARKARAPDPQPASTDGFEQLAGRASLGAWIVRVLERGSERLDPRRLRRLSPRAHLGERRLDRLALGRLEAERRPRDHLAVTQVRAAVGEPELPGLPPPVPPRSTTSTHSRTRASCPPYALAFMRTAPPTVPGMLTPNSRPVRPACAARADTAGSRAPPPHSIRVASISILLSSLSSFRTRPRTPASATRRFDPDPTTPTCRPSSAAHATRRSSAWNEPARANSSAGPPVRIVVSRASG